MRGVWFGRVSVTALNWGVPFLLASVVSCIYESSLQNQTDFINLNKILIKIMPIAKPAMRNILPAWNMVSAVLMAYNATDHATACSSELREHY